MKFKGNVNKHGIGLGLSMCKKIVDALDGSIKCRSKVEEGSKFTVLVPVKMANEIRRPVSVMSTEEFPDFLSLSHVVDV